MIEPFLSRPHAIMGGEQRLYRFPNTYGASVVPFEFSYGGSEGKWELAVVRYHGEGADDFEIAYDTPVTDDVLGWLEDSDVQALLQLIRALPRPEQTASTTTTKKEIR